MTGFTLWGSIWAVGLVCIFYTTIVSIYKLYIYPRNVVRSYIEYHNCLVQIILGSLDCARYKIKRHFYSRFHSATKKLNWQITTRLTNSSFTLHCEQEEWKNPFDLLKITVNREIFAPFIFASFPLFSGRILTWQILNNVTEYLSLLRVPHKFKTKWTSLQV